MASRKPVFFVVVFFLRQRQEIVTDAGIKINEYNINRNEILKMCSSKAKANVKSKASQSNSDKTKPKKDEDHTRGRLGSIHCMSSGAPEWRDAAGPALTRFSLTSMRWGRFESSVTMMQLDR